MPQTNNKIRIQPELLLTRCLATAFVALPMLGQAMTFSVSGDQLLMSGPVVGEDYAQVKNAFTANPSIKTVILRKSFGGDAWTGYRVGEYFREKGVTTVVSGWCVSSCSRMFLGGVERRFSDDFSPELTYVGFHGHYTGKGALDRTEVIRHGLKNWTLKHAGPNLPQELVESWINFPRNTQSVNFYSTTVASKFGSAIFECPEQLVYFDQCKAIKGNAKEFGIVTNEQPIASFDQNELRKAEQNRAGAFPPSGHADLLDRTRVPLDLPAGLQNYLRFVQSPLPRAFAVAKSRKHWAWNAGGEEETTSAALRRCQERAGQECTLYAVDNWVVYKP